MVMVRWPPATQLMLPVASISDLAQSAFFPSSYSLSFFFFFWWEVRTEKPTQFQSISGASLGPFLGNWYGSTEIATGRAYRFPFLNALGQCHGNTNEVDCHKGSLVIFYHIILDLFFLYCNKFITCQLTHLFNMWDQWMPLCTLAG